VLRDGETIATRDTAAIDRSELIQTMVGRALKEVFPKRPVVPGHWRLSFDTSRTARWSP